MRAQNNPHRPAEQISDALEREFRANVEHLVALGPRAVGEILSDIAARFLIRTEIEVALRKYRRLDPEIVAAVGGKFWQ
jgi:hypothetical protein